MVTSDFPRGGAGSTPGVGGNNSLPPDMQGETDVEKIQKLAKWLDFQLGEPVGNQVRAIAKYVKELQGENLRHRELYFAPTGDNHHNANLCPYCSPGGADLAAQLRTAKREAGRLEDKIGEALDWIKNPSGHGPEELLTFVKECLE